MQPHSSASRFVLFFWCLFAACAENGVNPDSDAMPTSDGPPSHVPSKRGLVELRLIPPLFSGESPRLEIHGGFIVADDPRCSRSVVDSCDIAICPEALIGNHYADPGKLALSPSNGLIAFTPGPSFLSFTADVIPWAANESITLSTVGAAVPPINLTVASPRTLDAGEGRSPFGPPLVKSQPFTATWVPLSEQVLLVLRQGRDTPDGAIETIVTCKGPGNAGRLSVPPDALTNFLAKASGGLSVEATAHAVREAAVDAGDFAVTYRVLRSFDEHFFHDVQ